MNKSFKNIVLMFLGTGMNLLLGIVTVPLITHLVNPFDYGQASLIQTYTNICVTICTVGLDQAYIRFYYSKPSIEYKAKLSRKIVLVPITLAILVSFGIVIFGNEIINNLPKHTLILAGACVITTVFETFTKLNVRLEQNVALYSLLLVIHRILYAGFIVIVLINSNGINSVDAIMLGTALSLLGSILIALLFERRIWLCRSNDNIDFKPILKYSIPFVFSSIANWLFTAADKLALQLFSTYDEIGYYSASSNIVALIAIIQTTFSALWVPMAVKTFENDSENKQFFVRSNDMMAFIMFSLGATLVLFKSVFGIVLGGNYLSAQYIYPCLLLHPIMFTLSETTVYGINFYKKTYWHIVITSLTCLIDVILNIITVQIWGGKGAAISTGISYIAFFGIRTIIANRYYNVPFHLNKVYIVTTALFGYFIYNTFNDIDVVGIVYYLGIMVLIMLLYKNTVYEFKEIVKSNFINSKL